MNKHITIEETPCNCPICSSYRTITIARVPEHEFWIKCAKCGYCGPKAETLQEAVEKWNDAEES